MSCASNVDDVPTRPCGLDVWYRPASADAQVHVVGSWDGFARPGRALRDEGRSDGYRHAWVDVEDGSYTYFLSVDGARVLDPHVPTTTFVAGSSTSTLLQYGGGGAPDDADEVNVVDVGRCAEPALVIDEVRARDPSSVTITAHFLANGVEPAALEPASVVAKNVVTGVQTAASFVDPARGAFEIVVGDLPPGKARFTVSAADRRGVRTQASASGWLEPKPLTAEDWVIYQVMIDRFRRDDAPPAAPSEAGGRAGGNLRGVISALVDGTFTRLGVRALWLSPLYDNPDGFFPGEPGRRYSGYHGYWPIAARQIEPDFGSEADVDALIEQAHARGIRVLFDLVPNHVHVDHPYFRERRDDGRFNGVDGACVCGSAQCPWDTSIQSCWFAPYLPDNNGRRDDVARREAADALWWLDRFGADGLRIDAVPMMTRALTRRIVWGARARLEHPGHPLFFLGETFVGQGGYADLRYQLGPQGLSSQFHFPLMWALRGAIASESQPMQAIAEVLEESAAQFAGSGAVMATMIGNHDVTRFASESDRSAGGDGWTPAPTPHDPRVYAKQIFALGLVFTLPGAPVIYYGDELALPGARDPDSRRVYAASVSAEQAQVRTATERFGQLRQCSTLLRRGALEIVSAARDRLVFTRRLGEARAWVIADRRADAPIAIDGSYRDALTGERFESSVPSTPWSLRVLLPEDDACASTEAQ